jgi:hypothetical protein
MTPQPTFNVRDHVTVIAYDLDAPGRVQECIWNGRNWVYLVECAINGDIKQCRFYADEIVLRETR